MARSSMLTWRWFVLMGLVLCCTWAHAEIYSPNTRALPSEQVKSGLHFLGKDVQALQADEFGNPAQFWLGMGEQLWRQPSPSNGKSCLGCHGDTMTSMQGVATRYPAVDKRNGRLMNLEDRINLCTTQHQKHPALAPESDALLGLTLLVAQASKGLPLQVSITGAAKPHWHKAKPICKKPPRCAPLSLT